MKTNASLALIALLGCALLVPGALGQATSFGNRKLLTAATISPADRLVNAQVNLVKKQYKAEVTQVVAKQDAVDAVSKALYKADAKTDKLNDKIESAADRAARLQARAAATNSIHDYKKAAVADIKVEQTVREVERKKDSVADRTDRKVDNALDKQDRINDRAADKVNDAQIRLVKAQAKFDKKYGQLPIPLNIEGAAPVSQPVFGAPRPNGPSAFGAQGGAGSMGGIKPAFGDFGAPAAAQANGGNAAPRPGGLLGALFG